MSDLVNELVFVDPDEVVPTWRVGLWAEPGQGKSVAAATAPGPILVVSADRPTAYMYVRKHHAAHWFNPKTGERLTAQADDAVWVPAKEILETRFVDWRTMELAYLYIREHVGKPGAIKTVVIDPLSNIYDYVVSTAPKQRRKDESDSPDYTWVNDKIGGFIKSLRPFDVNVVLIGHVKEPKKGSTMVGPNFGGPALSEKILRELDIVAHVQLQQLPPADPEDPDEKPRFRSIGQVQTLDSNLVCKDGTNALGAKRVLDLTRWFDLAAHALAPAPDTDMPWTAAEESAALEALAAAQADVPAPAETVPIIEREPEQEPVVPPDLKRVEEWLPVPPGEIERIGKFADDMVANGVLKRVGLMSRLVAAGATEMASTRAALATMSLPAAGDFETGLHALLDAQEAAA